MTLNLKIIVVEDIYNTLAGTIVKLEDLGSSVECAKCVVEAKKFLKQKQYDVLILDWRLPDNVGEQVNDIGGEIILKNLRTGNYGNINKNLPFIAVTAQKSVINSEHVIKFGGCIAIVYKLYYGDIIKHLQNLSIKEHI